jgi:hypothetical protein
MGPRWEDLGQTAEFGEEDVLKRATAFANEGRLRSLRKLGRI